jgi:hypothetical protein
MARNRSGPFVVAVALALALAACGDDGPEVITRACDRTGDPGVRECIRATGPARDIEGARSTCTEDGGVYTDRCPAAELVGCCAYSMFGLAISDCYYTIDPPRATDPEVLCDGLTVDGDPAVWTTTL